MICGIIYSYSLFGRIEYIGKSTGIGSFSKVLMARHGQHFRRGKSPFDIILQQYLPFELDIIATITGNSFYNVNRDLKIMELYFIKQLQPTHNKLCKTGSK